MENVNKKITSFTDLLAWKNNHRLVLAIYKITKNFPKEEIYGLTNQMRRASISITSNIAEGFGRKSFKEKINFYYIAKGSITELENQIIISKDVGYIDQNIFKKLIEMLTEGHKILNGLISKSKEYL